MSSKVGRRFKYHLFDTVIYTHVPSGLPGTDLKSTDGLSYIGVKLDGPNDSNWTNFLTGDLRDLKLNVYKSG